MEHTRVHVGGSWERRDRTLTVRAPWSGGDLAVQSLAEPEDVDRALTAAVGSLARPSPRFERAAVLDRVADRLRDDREVFARTIAQEVAKPIRSARAEVDRAVETIRFSALEARNGAGELVPMDAHHGGGSAEAFVTRVPRGVLVAVTPFNFPLNLVAHKVGPAVAADCPVVLKPAERAPLSAIGLVEAFLDAGLPPGRLQLLTGYGAELVPPLATDERTAVVSFTGSGAVGRSLEALAPHKPVLLELGSAAPLVVERDAELGGAIAAIVSGGFAHAGQSCVSVQRVYVHEARRGELLDGLSAAVSSLVVGDPLDESTDVSCLIDDAAAGRVEGWIAEAVAAGAEVAAGGQRSGRTVQPTVVVEPPTSSRLWSEEVFGPVVGLRSFREPEAVIEDVNGPAPVINAGVFTADLDLAMRYCRELDAGTVLVNESPTFRVDQMPYGGDGAAGNTREGPRAAVRELTREKLVILRTRA